MEGIVGTSVKVLPASHVKLVTIRGYLSEGIEL